MDSPVSRIAHIPDLTATPEQYSGPWFANADELREFKRIGALLLVARKPVAARYLE